MADRSVSVRISANIAQYQAAMAQMRQSTREVSSEITRSAAKNKQEFTQLGMGVGAAGAVMAVGLAKVVGESMQFEKAMSGVQSVANASAAEMDRLSDAAIKAGADVDLAGVTASSAAQAQMELVKAGVATSDVLGGALKGSLSLAVAGQLDMADAATISAQAMNIFKLEGSEVGHVADVLAAGANKSAADVGQLGAALRQGGLLASQTGLSLEETAGTLSAFADNALIGSDAGTSLKTMLQRLTPQSAEAEGMFKKLGFSAFDAAGEFVGMEELAGRLQAALGDMSTEQRNAAMGVMFGSDAIRGANVLVGLGAEGLKDYTDAVNDQGAATRMASIQTDNLAGDVEALGGAVESVMIDLGENAQAPLRSLTQQATNVVNTIGEMPETAQTAAIGLGALSSATALSAGGFLIAAPRIVATKTALTTLATSMPRTVGALRGMGAFLTGPWGLALGAATAGLMYYAHKKGEATARTEELVATLNQESGALTGESRALVYNNLVKEGAVDLAKKMGVSLRDVTDAAMGNAEAQTRVNEAMQQYRQNEGGSASSLGDVVVLTGKIREQRDAVEATAEAWREQQSAMSDAATTGSGASWRLAESGTAAASSITALRDASMDAVGGVQELTDAQEALEESIAGFFDPIGAYTNTLADKEAKERETAEATAAATKSSKDSWEDYARDVTVSLDEYMDALQKQINAGRDWETNMTSLALRVSDTTLDYLARLGPEGAPLVADLVDASDEELRRFERLAKRTGENVPEAIRERMEAAAPVLRKVAQTLGKGAADGLAEQLRKGTTTVAQIVGQYGWMLAQGINPILIGVGKNAIAVSAGSGAHWRAVEERFAAGGAVGGARTHRDTVPAMLTPGEYVHTESAVDYYGTDVMDALNRRRIPKSALRAYNAGGFVSPDEVARPPSVAAYGNVIGHTGAATMEHAYEAAIAFVERFGLGGDLVQIGRALQGMGYHVSRHGAFGGTPTSGHAPGSLHYDDRAIDVNWYPAHEEPARLDAIYPRLAALNPTELLWRVPNHDVGDNPHLHLGFNSGGLVPGCPGCAMAAARNPKGSKDNPWVRDAGGPLLPGYTLNATGRAETVVPAQTRTAAAAVPRSESIRDQIAELQELIRVRREEIDAEDQAARRREMIRVRDRAERQVEKADKKELAAATRELRQAEEALANFDRDARRAARERRVQARIDRLEQRAHRVEEREELRADIADNRDRFRYERMSTEQQLAETNRRLDAERRFTAEWMRLKEQQQRLREQISRDTQDDADAAARALEDAAEAAARAVQDRIAAASSGVDAAQRTYDAALSQLNAMIAEEARVREQINTSIDRYNEQRTAAEAQFNADQQQILNERARALETWARLDQRVRVSWGNTAAQVLANAREQGNVFAEWQRSLDVLRDRGLSEQAIEALGLADSPEALGQVRALVAGTDAELGELNEVVLARAEQAGQQAAVEAQRLFGDVGRRLIELRTRHDEEMAALQAAFIAEQQELSEQLANIGQQQGLTFSEAIAAGIRSGIPAIRAAAAEAQQAMQALQDAQAALDEAKSNTGGGGATGGGGGTSSDKQLLDRVTNDNIRAIREAQLKNPATRDWALDKLRTQTFDVGGFLQPGFTLAYNGTGQPEPVIRDMPSFLRAASQASPRVDVQVFVGGKPIRDEVRVVINERNTGTAIAGSR